MAGTGKLADLADKLRSLKSGRPLGTALIGFDGYIDRVVRLKKNQMDPPDLFEHIGDFARHIQEHPGSSQDIAVKRISEKIGGNGPLMAESLSVKNVAVSCIGAFGYPEMNPGFDEFSKKAALFSVDQNAFTLALEFNDAKIMLAETEALDRINWEKLVSVIGEEKLGALIQEADIIGVTNWSGLSKSNDILEGILSVFPRLFWDRKRLCFFDLADPSGKSTEQFRDLFRLIEKLSSWFDIILGLNRKETVFVYNHFFNRQEKSFDETMAVKLAETMALEEVVIHGAGLAAAADKKNYRAVQGTTIQSPVILTGAGDNFNAGYCLGKLCGFDVMSCLYLADISASLYVQQGFSAGIDAIIMYIEHFLLTRSFT
jgi:bifunctional ADP-heptose synthase (sugar kinase/adenylyltransferase)